MRQERHKMEQSLNWGAGISEIHSRMRWATPGKAESKERTGSLEARRRKVLGSLSEHNRRRQVKTEQTVLRELAELFGCHMTEHAHPGTGVSAAPPSRSPVHTGRAGRWVGSSRHTPPACGRAPPSPAGAAHLTSVHAPVLRPQHAMQAAAPGRSSSKPRSPPPRRQASGGAALGGSPPPPVERAHHAGSVHGAEIEAGCLVDRPVAPIPHGWPPCHIPHRRPNTPTRTHHHPPRHAPVRPTAPWGLP